MAEETSCDKIIAYLSHRPKHIIDGVISVQESNKLIFPVIRRQSPAASLGRLDDLPLEVLHETLQHLDLQSMSHFSRVSLRGKAVAESLPIYRNLVEVIGHTFAVLRRASVLGRHSCITLRAALSSEKCVCCLAYAPFLLLLSAERCCFNCLLANQSLWMISLPMAEKAFGLSKRRLNRLPTLQSIPGVYCVKNRQSRQKSIKLTSVRAAKEAALKKYGSIEALTAIHPEDTVPLFAAKTELLNCYRNASLAWPSHDPLTMEIEDWYLQPLDPFGGMGSIPFPSLSSDGSIENGLWCRGCEWIYGYYAIHGMDLSTISRLVPQGSHASRYLSRARLRAWSREEFLDHARSCLKEVEVLPQDELD